MSGKPALRAGVVGCGPIGKLHAAAACRSPVRQARERVRHRSRASRSAWRGGGRRRRGPHPRFEDLLVLDVPRRGDRGDPRPSPCRGGPVGDHRLGATSSARSPWRRRPRTPGGWSMRPRDRGVVLGVHHNRRFGFGYRIRPADSSTRAARRRAERCVILHVVDRTPRPEVARVPEVILTTLLTHHLDLARWFGGEATLISTRFGPADPAAAQLRRTVATDPRIRRRRPRIDRRRVSRRPDVHVRACRARGQPRLGERSRT